MLDEITVNNYDVHDKAVIGDVNLPFQGVNIGNTHYIIAKKDYVGSPYRTANGTIVPRRAYELVYYNKQKHQARAREVIDKSDLERIAREFHKIIMNGCE